MHAAAAKPSSDAPAPCANGGYRVEAVDTIGPAWDAVVASFADGCLAEPGKGKGNACQLRFVTRQKRPMICPFITPADSGQDSR